jgi:hypothetical protein
LGNNLLEDYAAFGKMISVYILYVSVVLMVVEIVFPFLFPYLNLPNNLSFFLTLVVLGLGISAGVTLRWLDRKAYFKKIDLLFTFTGILLCVIFFSLPFIGFWSSNPDSIFFFVFFLLALYAALLGCVFIPALIFCNTFKTLSFHLLGLSLGFLYCKILLSKIGGENLILLTGLLGCFVPLFKKSYSLSLRRLSYIFIIVLSLGLFVNLRFASLDILNLLPVKQGETSFSHSKFKHPEIKRIDSSWNLISRIDTLQGPRFILDEGLASLYFMSAKEKEKRGRNEDVETIIYSKNQYFSRVIKNQEHYSFPWPGITQGWKEPNILVIGTGGGNDLAAGLNMKNSHVLGVEINPAIVEVMRGKLAGYSGEVYLRSRIFCQDGRNFLQNTKEKFNLITLNNTDVRTVFPNSRVDMENYLYTLEGVQELYKKLTDDGVVYLYKNSTMFLNYPYEALKILATFSEALRSLGAGDLRQHCIVYYVDEAVDSPYFIFSKQKIDRDMAVKLFDTFPENIKFLYYPFFISGQNNVYQKFILSTDQASFIASYPYDISPTTDEKPFFYEWNKKKSFLWNTSFKIFWLIIIIFLVFTFNNITLVVKQLGFADFFVNFYYFSVISICYMLLETSFMLAFNLYLLSPLYSLSCIILSFCIIGAFSNYVFYKFPGLFSIKKMIYLLIGYLLILILSLKVILRTWHCDGIIFLRILVVVILLTPVIFTMSYLFPWRLSRLPEATKGFFCFCNYIFAPLGCLITAILTRYLGNRLTLMVGGSLYFTVIMCILFWQKRTRLGGRIIKNQ